MKELVTDIVIPKLDEIGRNLERKADRDRVHDLAADFAAFRLLTSEALSKKADSDRVTRLETWRNVLSGGVVVVAFFASVNGLRVWFW